MITFDVTQAAIVAAATKQVSWLFTVTDNLSNVYYWSTKAYTYGGQAYTFKVLPDSFDGVTLNRGKSELGLQVPSDLTFDVSNKSNALTAANFTDGSVLLKLVIKSGASETIIRQFKFRIKDAITIYQKMTLTCEDYLQGFLAGDYPNTPFIKSLFYGDDVSIDDDNVCVPIPFGTAYVPLRSVYVGDSVTLTGTTFSCVASSDGARCQIVDSASGFANVEIGRLITVSGFTEAANAGTFQVLARTNGTIEIASDAGLVTEAAGDAVTIKVGSRYYVLGPSARTYTIARVRSPRDSGVKSEWTAAGGYTFTQATKTDPDSVTWKMFHPIISDVNQDGTPDAPGYWRNGGLFLDMPTQFSRDDTVSLTNPADVIEFILKDMGLVAGDLDATSFAAAKATYSTWEKDSATELMPNQVDRDFSGASAWADHDLVSTGGTYDETGDLSIHSHAINADCYLPVASAPTTPGKTYKLTVDVANLHGTWRIYDYSATQLLTTITADGAAQEHYFIATTAGGLRIIADNTDGVADFDNFSLKESGLEFNGALWYKETRESLLARLLTMCHSYLTFADKIYLKVRSKTSRATITQATVLKQSGSAGSFTYRGSSLKGLSNCGHIHWQPANEAQDKFLCALVPVKASKTVISSESIEVTFVQDSQNAQRIGTLYYQRKLGKMADISFPGKATLLALEPDDIITINYGDYGGNYDVLVDSISISRDLTMQINGVRFAYALDDWADLNPTAITVYSEDTTQLWQPPVSGPLSAKNLGTPSYDAWGKEYLVISPVVNQGKYTNIQEALNAMPASGGSIYMKNGTYTHSAPIYVPDKDLDLFGESQGGVILKNHAGDDLFDLYCLTKKYSFHDFSIESQNTSSYSKMVRIYGSGSLSDNTAYVAISRLRLTLAAGGDDGIYGYKGNGTILASGLDILYGENAIYIDDILNTQIKGNTLSSQISAGVAHSLSVIGQCIISGNIIGNVIKTGISMECDYGNCIDNQIVMSEGAGLSDPCRGIYADGYGAIVSRNIITAYGTNPETCRFSGMYIVNGTKNKITDNQILLVFSVANTVDGILLTISDSIVTGNVIHLENSNHSNASNGIYLYQGDRNVIASNNIAMLDDANDIGIYLSSGADNNQGSDNITYNCGTGISDAGTGNSVTGKDV